MKFYRRFITKETLLEKTGIISSKKHGSYGALLLDKRWREKRSFILLRDNSRCIICGSESRLEVHHRQYHYESVSKKFKAPWEYSNNILITLCNSCHQRGHSKFKIPIIYV